MTETASLDKPESSVHAAQGSVGKILPGRDFRLAEDGEILVRGENVADSYWQGGAMRAASPENDGWLRTGDLGELDAKGLRFCGRKKSVIATPPAEHPPGRPRKHAAQAVSRAHVVVIPLESGGNAEPCAVFLLSLEQAPVVGAELARPTRSAQLDSPDSIAQSAIDTANSTLAEYSASAAGFSGPMPTFPAHRPVSRRLAVIANAPSSTSRPRLAPIRVLCLRSSFPAWPFLS